MKAATFAGALALVLFTVPALAQQKPPANSNPQKPAASAPQPPATTPKVSDDFVIGIEDVLSINVWRDPDSSAPQVVVRPDGSIFLPAEVAERLKAGPGGVVMAMLEGDAFKLVSVETAMEEARRIVAKYIPKDVSLVDSFLANRRRMWGEDDEGADG